MTDLTAISNETIQEYFAMWKRRWKKYFNRENEYFEEDSNELCVKLIINITKIKLDYFLNRPYTLQLEVL